MGHKCKEMLRDETLRTPIGQAAWAHYQDWMTRQRKVVARPESFLDSRFFNSFIKFATWAIQVGIPDTSIYVRLMVEKQISPMIWTDDEIYAMFIEHFDHTLEPMEHARIAIDTLIELCDIAQCQPSDLFAKVDCSVIIDKLRQRKLSPWILLNSKQFKHFYVNRTNASQKVIMQNLIQAEHWHKIFQKRPNDVVTMKQMTQELGI